MRKNGPLKETSFSRHAASSSSWFLIKKHPEGKSNGGFFGPFFCIQKTFSSPTTHNTMHAQPANEDIELLKCHQTLVCTPIVNKRPTKRKLEANRGRADGAASFEGQPSPKVRQHHTLFVSTIFSNLLVVVFIKSEQFFLYIFNRHQSCVLNKKDMEIPVRSPRNCSKMCRISWTMVSLLES